MSILGIPENEPVRPSPKLQQYRNCLKRPELPQLKESDKCALVQHVFGLGGILLDSAKQLDLEVTPDKLFERLRALVIAGAQGGTRCTQHE